MNDALKARYELNPIIAVPNAVGIICNIHPRAFNVKLASPCGAL
jgi:hypothetical protein